MEIQSKTRSYAYRAAAGGILAVVLENGAYSAIPLYILPISEAVGASVGQVSLLFTFAAIAGLAGSLAFGSLLGKFKVRTIISLAGVSLAIFFTCISFAASLPMLYVGSFFFGLSTSVGGFAIAQTEITWWFSKGIGKLMSLPSIALGIICLIQAPILANALNIHGVRTVALVHGLGLGILIILNALFVLVEHPGKYGLLPLGYSEEAIPEQDAEVLDGGKSLTLKQMAGTAPFWLIALALMLVMAALTGFTNNASAFYQSLGLDSVDAALCISIYSAATLAWSPLYGVLIDKLGTKTATVVCGAIGVAVLICGTFLTGFTGAVIIAALVGVLNFSGMLGPVCYPQIYGTREAANLVGISNAAGSVGAMLGAPLAGFIYDATGSYSVFLITAAAMTALCILFVMIGTSKKAIQKINKQLIS